MFSNALSSKFFVGIGVAYLSTGCVSRDFNSANSNDSSQGSSAQSVTAPVTPSSKVTFSCNLAVAADPIDKATGKIIPGTEPKPAPVGYFEFSIDDAGAEHTLQITKDYSFSHWASVAAGTPSKEAKGTNTTNGKIVSATAATCQRSYCYKLKTKIWPANADESKATDFDIEFWTAQDKAGDKTFDKDPTVVIYRNDASKLLGGVLGHCIPPAGSPQLPGGKDTGLLGKLRQLTGKP